ncbi:hypothetical protein NDU88_000487 [Pleurodeles waltl]|uniref:Uncharacterized protein n=1 Tax=Pleurodeles waltl TaxID=8319 RepID=A0AAV7L8H8_PLEWA|nr:hypothetical protein NDU88_000487 [Pleurodeles waltl]
MYPFIVLRHNTAIPPNDFIICIGGRHNGDLSHREDGRVSHSVKDVTICPFHRMMSQSALADVTMDIGFTQQKSVFLTQ